MGKRGNESDYESLRAARISENEARMEMLGLRRAKEELNGMAAAPPRRPNTLKQHATGPPRRSPRLNGQPVQHTALPLIGPLSRATPLSVVEEEEDEDEENGDHNVPAVVGEEMVPAPEDSGGDGTGAVYEPVRGETAVSGEEAVQRE